MTSNCSTSIVIKVTSPFACGGVIHGLWASMAYRRQQAKYRQQRLLLQPRLRTSMGFSLAFSLRKKGNYEFSNSPLFKARGMRGSLI